MSNADEIERVFHKTGFLLGEKPKNGIGVVRNFAENGCVSLEYWMHHGQPIGYVKKFDVDGKTLLFAKFWYRLKYLSKKRYHALCDKNPELPRFDEIEEYDFLAEDLKLERRRQREEAKKIKSGDNTKDRQKIEEFCRNILNQEESVEAILWLSQDKNTLGELQTNAESLSLIRKLYRLGVEKVFVIEIQSDNHGGNSGKLVLKLPENVEKRKIIFRWSDKQAREQGFDPDVDIGQKYMFVMLD